MIHSRLFRPKSFFNLIACGCGILSLFPGASLAQLPAFPGAEGFGRFATGGRGGTVVFVTNTNDSGPGSFREAVSSSGRTVIFRVGGVINYSGSRYNVAPNVTIAGQTAPGDGVTLYGDGIGYTGSHNTITRFIRYRMGIQGESDKDAVGISSGDNMIFDHITASWGRDETFSINGSGAANITIQSSIISQGLQTHSAGGLIQPGGGVSILRTLYIDNDTRNPKVKGINEFVNNVVCNWETIGYNMGGDSSGESFANVFNNYFMRGPNSSSTAIGGGNTDFHIYRANNWYDGNRNGILDGSDLSPAAYGSHDPQVSPYAYPISTGSAHSPLTALKLAISDAGPSFRRDSVDERMITELISWGTLGGTITSELLPPMNGPGIIRNGTPYPDGDNDGMPDFWENGTGSNPSVANNNNPSPSGSGYTRLEDYLNWLAEPHGIALMNTNVVVDLRQFTRGWVVVNRNPVWSVSNPVNGSVTLLNGYFAQFTPTPGHNGPASFQFTVNDNDGGPLTRTMNLFFTPSAQGYQAVWRGDDLANNWNTLGDYNWSDGISLLYQFHNGERVLFDDTGSTNPTVNLSGSLQPASVTINATKNYTFSGTGSLDGTMSLLMTNTGTLTIHTTNTYTGATTISNGTLLVHGALNSSPVTVGNGGTIGGNGSLGNSVTVYPGGSLSPGSGSGNAGGLSIANVANFLTLSGGTTSRFDLSDDPTGTIKTNDVIHITGSLNASGVNTIRVSLLDGLPGNGVYTLITYSGAFNGSIANFAISGVSGTLTNPPGSIAILVDATRPPATLTWLGDNVNNIWDTGTSVTWLNEGAPDRFYFLDDVVFNNSGSTTPDINLQGELSPNSVTVAADVNYTFSGSGRISATTGLTKTNSGTLTINNANDYTGPTVIGGGSVVVNQLANGGVASRIGAATSDPANLVMSGGTLRYTGGSATIDRGATLTGFGGTFEVNNAATTLTWNGTNIGTGSLIKSGPGTLTLSADNDFTGGTIISDGTLALNGPSGGGTVTANNYALGSGSVTFQGGTLKLFGHAASTSPDYGNFSRPMIIPADETGTLLTPPRYTLSAPLSGAGTLNLEVDYVRGSMSGNWSAFTGVINVFGRVANSEFRITSTAGYANAAVYLNNNVVITRSGSATTIDFGTLGATSGARIGPGNSTSSGTSYRVGWRNEDAVFAGQILADGQNTITKVGTGNWTLTGANTYSGGTVVSGGTLTVNNTSGSGTGTSAVSVNTDATLAGTGTISGATTIASGATVSPGNGGIGTLTINNTVTLSSGSTTLIEINKTSGSRDQLNAGSSTLIYGGVLVVTNLNGTLANGDSFKIFNAGTYAGAFTTVTLPPLAPELNWNTAALGTSGTISVVSTNFVPPQPITWQGDGVANVWNTAANNWLGTNGQPRAFANGDSVTFNNSGSTTPAINLTASVSPGAMTINASQDYTLIGPGALTGSMVMTKSGSGRFTVANTGANTFSGSIVISAGALQIGDGVSVNGNLPGNIVNNATLIFANPNAQTWSSVFTGSGTLVKHAAGNLTVSSTNTSYSGNVLIGGGEITLTTGAALNTGSLTLSNGGTFNFPPSSPAYFYPGTITVPANQTGTLFSPGLGNGVNGSLISGNSSSVLYISSGVSFAATSTSQFDSFSGTINILPGGTLRYSPNSSGNTYGSLNPTFHVDGALRPRNAGNTVRLGKVAGSGSLAGPQSNAGSGNTTYQIGGANVDSTFAGNISSESAVASSLVVLHKVGAGRLTLTGASTYTGGTIISNGSLFVSNSSGSGTGTGSVIARNGTTLGGSGTISGNTTIENGATLSPGDAIGTFTFGGNLILQTTAKSHFALGTASDQVIVTGTLTVAGTIDITAAAGFGAGTYTLFLSSSGLNIGPLQLGTLPAGFNYALNTATPGQIRLVVTSIAPPTPPSFTNATITGANFVAGGTGGTLGGTYYVVSSTNVALPIDSWLRVTTNNFDGAGNFAFTNAIAPGVPQQFYRLQMP